MCIKNLNTNKNIISISGLSGSGKTTVANILSEKIPNSRRIVTATTRPIRPTEKDGRDYSFINNTTYLNKLTNKEIIISESFKVANDEIWFYGVYKNDLNNVNIPIIVLTPKGVHDLRKMGFNVISFYINVNEVERLKRINLRKDNQGEKEINRRSREDRVKFNDFEYDYLIDNSDLNSCIDKILMILKSKNII